MISKKLLISLLFISLIVSINCVNAVDSSDWKTVKINNVDFKLPPKYHGCKFNRDTYIVNNIFTFGIRCVDSDISYEYMIIKEK